MNAEKIAAIAYRSLPHGGRFCSLNPPTASFDPQNFDSGSQRFAFLASAQDDTLRDVLC